MAAARLDAEKKVLHLDDGTGLPFDGLVIATGSRARRLGVAETRGTYDGELTLAPSRMRWRCAAGSRISRPSSLSAGELWGWRSPPAAFPWAAA